MPWKARPRCSIPRCPHLAPCPVHRRQRTPDTRTSADRGTTTQRGYGAAHRRARARLLADSPPCDWCGEPATTADHVPALQAFGGDVTAWERAGGFLVPACALCNYGRRGIDN